jgi:competence protein ComEA
MHDAEARALRRAVVILLLVSSARWGWSRAFAPDAPSGTSVLPELLAGSAIAAEEQARRDRPLAEGELIDPNRADEIDLDRLPGVGPATARAIVEAREAGIAFRRPEDLQDVRGIGAATVRELRGSLDFSAPPPVRARQRSGLLLTDGLVDVNRASAEALQDLPGVGPALAGRIVAEREKRMFSSVDDLVRVPGIGPATLERLRARVLVNGRP